MKSRAGVGGASNGRRARDGFNPSRTGKGAFLLRLCTILCPMDINTLIAPVIEFFGTTLGQQIGNILRAIYTVLYPPNAAAARVEPTP